MRLLFFNPPSAFPVLRDYYCSSASKAAYLWHPVDILAQTALLGDLCELRVLDAVAERKTAGECSRIIGEFSPDAVFALTSATTWKEDFRVLEDLKKRFGFKLVLSGEIFLSDAKELLSKHPWIDAALLNFTGPDLRFFLEGSPSRAENLAWREEEEVVVRRKPARGAFRLGLPRHDLFAIKRYRMPWHKHHPFATVMTDYGCPFGCAFCNSRTLGYATREPDDLKNELLWLHGRGVKQLFMKDMTFAADKRHAKDVMEMIIRHGWRFSWNAYSRADLIDEEIAGLMSRAGCHLVQIGVESADEKLLAEYGKKITPDRVREAFRILRKNEIRVGAHFILGLPGDSLESMRRTVELAVELNPVYASFNIAMPRLGTSLDNAGWRERPLDSSGSVPFYPLNGISPKELIRERNRALRRFYLRPAYFREVVSSIETPYQLKNLARQAMGMAGERFRSIGGKN